MSTGDRILLTGLTVRAFHGVHAEERERGQDFVIDVELVVPLGVAAATDDVLGTVHYGELARAIVAAVERDPVDLIETVADRVARLALADDRVERAVVTVHKPQAPIGLPFADVAVRVERTAERLLPRSHVVIALGGNLGDPAATLDAAVAALGRLPGLTVTAVSRPIETVAVTAAGPDPDKPRYVNRVAVGETTLEPRALLAALLGIERVFGRRRLEHWGDRTLDLDLIAHGDLRIDEPGLTVPHPRAHERDFVLAPWLEVEPDAGLPGRGSVRDLLAALGRPA
ncbi:MAG TPA: 2-amino-4-hydroxy-6-hydroxymethyldihydropteridine diphosphokinase [Amnibacterium sp.]|jgi:dihydroneopterin aldolase/2-amino-4-hydroxy-6-hydroxymethyldihydropteridine diphosphokinase